MQLAEWRASHDRTAATHASPSTKLAANPRTAASSSREAGSAVWSVVASSGTVCANTFSRVARGSGLAVAR